MAERVEAWAPVPPAPPETELEVPRWDRRTVRRLYLLAPVVGLIAVGLGSSFFPHFSFEFGVLVWLFFTAVAVINLRVIQQGVDLVFTPAGIRRPKFLRGTDRLPWSAIQSARFHDRGRGGTWLELDARDRGISLSLRCVRDRDRLIAVLDEHLPPWCRRVDLPPHGFAAQRAVPLPWPAGIAPNDIGATTPYRAAVDLFAREYAGTYRLDATDLGDAAQATLAIIQPKLGAFDSPDTLGYLHALTATLAFNTGRRSDWQRGVEATLGSGAATTPAGAAAPAVSPEDRWATWLAALAGVRQWRLSKPT